MGKTKEAPAPPPSDDDLLNARLAEGDGYGEMRAGRPGASMTNECAPAAPMRQPDQDVSQWMLKANGVLRPASRTAAKLEAGLYTVHNDELGVFFMRRNVVTDECVELPDSATQRVVEGIRGFWKSRKRYLDHGLVYKRGVLLWGPPGSGKTVTVALLAKELIATNGLVVFCSRPSLCAEGLRLMRMIEPGRPLIVVCEDVDEIIMQHGEHELLAMLDGEFAIDNVVYVATTNYPERLGARIVNRPSRFDERIYVGMPSQEARCVYLAQAMRKFGYAGEPREWARDTAGLSIAHLRELVAAVLCLEQPYAEVLGRLRSMCERPKGDQDGFERRRLGLV
jgi:hypothetical protein